MSVEEIIERIAFNALTPTSKLTVTGHTDDVPIGGGLYRDNWDLAAARASSVVQTIQATGVVPPLEAVSKGENQPVASNADAFGRERNRRIEIEINY